jgi:hypothetical protein
MRISAMAKTAAPLSPAPSFKFPEPKLPKLDLEALFAAQRANLGTAQEAQTVLTDAAQAIARVQYGYVEQAATGAKAALAGKELPKPETALANVKSGVETAVAVAEEVVDLAVGAQKRVVELLTQRGQANVSELKALAA